MLSFEEFLKLKSEYQDYVNSEKKDPEKKDPEKKDPEKKDPEKKDPEKKDPKSGSELGEFLDTLNQALEDINYKLRTISTADITKPEGIDDIMKKILR